MYEKFGKKNGIVFKHPAIYVPALLERDNDFKLS